MNNNFFAITIGDIEGIGIELLIKLWKNKKNNNFILFSNKEILNNFFKKNNIKIKLKIVNHYLDKKKIKKIDFNNCLNIFDFSAKNNFENTYYSIIYSHKLTRLNYFKGIITLPLNKEKIIKNIDSKFIGQTEFFQKLDNKKISNMVFIYKKLIVVTLTTHIPLKKVNKILSKNNFIYNKIDNINKSLNRDFKIKKPKIAIAGINPHASENNTIGNDDEKILCPIIKKLKKKKINIIGPISADSLLSVKNMKKIDCFIFNYHDQALIPFKLLSKNKGVNFTSGLDVIRVSPDFGTAYDIIGKNIATTESLINCIKFIKKISNNRNNFVNT